MALATLDMLNGIFSIIFVSISTIVGLIVAFKYFKYKKPIFLYMGLTWVLIVSPWWASSVSILVAITTSNDEGLSLGMYLLVGNIMMPLYMIFIVASITEFTNKDWQRIGFIITLIIGILFEIYLCYFLFVNPSEMGTKKGVVDIEFSGFLRLYLIINIFLALIAGIVIARISHRSENPEVRLKGGFILIATLIWVVGAIFDGFLTLNVLTLTIIRLVLISSSIFFYFGFFTPNWLKNHFIKE